MIVAWLILSILGAGLSAYLSLESYLDLRALGARANGRRVAALSRLVREGMRLTVHGAYIFAGLAALDLVPGRELIIPILMYGNLALVVNSIIDARARGRMWQTAGHDHH
jgi:hypothetical protein